MGTVLTSDNKTRLDLKDKLLGKIETALIEPTSELESDPIIEIVNKYSKWTPARFSMDSEEFMPDFKKDELFIPEGEVHKRITIKSNAVRKVNESLASVQTSPENTVEIIEKYSQWTPAGLLDPIETLSPDFKKNETIVFPRELEKRENIRLGLSDKVKNSSIVLEPESEPEPDPIEIVDKYSNWIPARLAIQQEDQLPIEIQSQEAFILTSEIGKRGAIKQNISRQLHHNLDSSPLDEDPEPIEILENYSNWIPARFDLTTTEDPPEVFKKEELFIPQGELLKRESKKLQLLSTIVKALSHPVEQLEESIEIIDKYSNWAPARLEIQVEDQPLPTIKNQDPFILTSELDKRDAIKLKILTKVENSLAPVPMESEPVPISILEKYINWVPARFSLGPEEFVPEPENEAFFISQGEILKRESIKLGMLDKVNNSLTIPNDEVEVPVIEILEKYSNWVPARLNIETEELLVEPEKEGYHISQADAYKRAIIKLGMLEKVKESLTLPMVETESEIEILEKYSNWIPSRLNIEQEELLLDPTKEEFFISQGDADKREILKSGMLDKVKESLTPPIIEVEPEIELSDKYLDWIPARYAMEPEELLPEYKKEANFIPNREIEKRQSIKFTLSKHLEDSLTPDISDVEPESVPIEILEKYSTWIPARFDRKPDELLPEFKEYKSAISPRELENRESIKHNMFNRLTQSMIPTSLDSGQEASVVEIIDKFAMGIPQYSQESFGTVFPEPRRILEPEINVTDIPKRLSFKDNLFKKIATPLSDVDNHQVEILDYSQRSTTQLGFDFEESKDISIIVSDESEIQNNAVEIVTEPLMPILLVPENYAEFDEGTLYGILIRNPDLKHTSETANLTLDILYGRSTNPVELVIIPNEVVIPPIVKETKVQPVLESIVEANVPMVVPSPVVNKVETFADIKLPDDWKTVPLSVLRTDLLSTGVTPEAVDFKLASMVSANSKDLINVGSEFEELIIELPESFGSWKSNSQYIYLTKELKLTPEKANSIIWELN